MTAERKGWTSETASALVELALALPLLVTVLVATIDFSRVFYTAIALTNAARAGVQYGSFTPGQSGNIALMQTTATSSTTTTGMTAVASRSCQCATDTGTFSATSPTANDCTNTCPGGHLVVTVTVTTSKTFSLILSGFPGIPSTVSLTRTATMRAMQ